MHRYYLFPNRTLCDCLDELRKAYETRNFSYMLGIIEEAQSMGNRMEGGLADKRDLREAADKKTELKKEIRKLEEKLELLTKLTGTEGDRND